MVPSKGYSGISLFLVTLLILVILLQNSAISRNIEHSILAIHIQTALIAEKVEGQRVQVLLPPMQFLPFLFAEVGRLGFCWIFFKSYASPSPDKHCTRWKLLPEEAAEMTELVGDDVGQHRGFRKSRTGKPNFFKSGLSP